MRKTMSRAEDAAHLAYPNYWKFYPFETNKEARAAFIKGYEQAEKEFAGAIKTAEDHAYFAGSESMREKVISIIESRISEILGDAQPAPILRSELQELIDKFK